MKECFGIDGVALNWINSYLSDRHQKVIVDGTISDSFQVPFGVPQGSRLGPLLFTLYTSSLIKSTRDNFPEVSCHCYADDTQLFISFRPNPRTADASVSMLEKCTAFIRRWMLNNRLKLNDSKSEFLVIGTSQQISKISIDCIKVGFSNVKPSDTVRNLGVQFDTNLNMEKQITNVCKST